MENNVTTLIIGTAKSKVGKDEYYVSERLRMWGVMFIAGFTDKYYKPHEHREFTEKYKVGFYDIVEIIESKDETLKNNLRENKEASLIYKGVENFFQNITNYYPNLSRIGFNGKTIASWVLEYNKTNNITASSKYLQNVSEKSDEIYKKQFELVINNRTIIANVLPNTSGRASNFDEQPWIDFWKSIKESSKK